MVEAKGHPRLLYQGVLVAMWFGGEVTGVIIGVVVISALGGAGQRDFCFCYLCAVFFAAVGGGRAFLVAAAPPNQGRRGVFHREHYPPRPLALGAGAPPRPPR